MSQDLTSSRFDLRAQDLEVEAQIDASVDLNATRMGFTPQALTVFESIEELGVASMQYAPRPISYLNGLECSSFVTESQIWRAIIAALRQGMDANCLQDVAIKQSYQPIKEGANTQDTVYLFKVASKRTGFQSRNYSYNDVDTVYGAEEKYFVTATYQLTANVVRDVSNEFELTAYDVTEKCSAIMQSVPFRKKLLESGIGILRITDVRNPYHLDDYEQFDQDSNFDFVITYENILSRFEQRAFPINLEIDRV